MSNQLFTNNAATTLASGISSSATSLTVATGNGALFPNPTVTGDVRTNQYFLATLQNTAGTVKEIVKVTARSGDTFTIVRAQEGTTASAFVTGDTVTLRATAAGLTNFVQNNSNNYGFRNRLINGGMLIAQRASSGTSGSSAPTTSPVYPCVDRFYVYATGTTVTVANAPVSFGSSVKLLQITGSSSVTTIGVGQRIESVNCYDLAGKLVTISLNTSNTTLTTVTWTAYQPTATDNYTSKTQIATGTFTVSSTDNVYQATFTMPTGTMTGLEIVFTVGAQTSGYWYLYNIQLEQSDQASSFEVRDYNTELQRCQRYFQIGSAGFEGPVVSGSNYSSLLPFSVPMYATPTIAELVGGTGGLTVNFGTTTFRATTGNQGALMYRTATATSVGAWFTNFTMAAEI